MLNFLRKSLRFAADLLERLPANYQSCQSLRMYCEKKLKEKVKKAPAEAPGVRVEGQKKDWDAITRRADNRGRIEGMMTEMNTTEPCDVPKPSPVVSTTS